MADKPSRGLVLYGDGLMRFVNSSHTHLHSLASKASCGFLSLSEAPPLESEDDRIVREFAQLLDASESYQNIGGEAGAKLDCQNKCSTPTISERFMGMKAAVVTSNLGLQCLGGKLGLTVIPLNELIKSKRPLAQSPIDIEAIELLKLLGFQEETISETSQFDLVLVHLGAGEKANDQEISKHMEHTNALIGKINQIAAPGSKISSRLLLSAIMSYGEVSENDDPSLSVLKAKDEMKSDLSSFFPRQSYTMRGRNVRENVRHHCPMLMAQSQDAVTRRDRTRAISFEDFKQHGGNCTIPADRFLHEVAFKLWKAPKYGA